MEPLQYNNPNGKWQDVIPHMIINLKYDRDIYLSKDTIMAYALEEDKNFEYLGVNEVIKSTKFCNWPPRQRKYIFDSDLVFSPAQVTEHHHVELKDQEISQEKIKTTLSWGIFFKQPGYWPYKPGYYAYWYRRQPSHLSKTLHLAP